MFESSKIINKYPEPVLTRKDVPYNSCLVFNAGVIKHEGKYVMMFRNDYGDFEAERLDGTNIGIATSDDGIKWEVRPAPVNKINSNEQLRERLKEDLLDYVYEEQGEEA